MVAEGSTRMDWLCNGGFHLSSACTQRSILDALNLLFLLSFSLTLLAKSFHKPYSRHCIFLVVSLCCALTAAAYFSVAVFSLLNGVPSAVFLVRSLVWVALAFSLQVHLTKCTKILVSLWWASFSLLASFLNVQTLARNSFQVLDLISWPVNVLLLFCAAGNLVDRGPHSLVDPLLLSRTQSELATSGFFSRSTFSWMNSLLQSGSRKPLNLDSVPRLEVNDGSALAINDFLWYWSKGNSVISSLAFCYSKEMIVVGFYALLRTIAVVSLPLILHGFVVHAQGGHLLNGLALVGALMAAKVTESLSQRHWFFDSRRVGMRMRSALAAAVFRKQLLLSGQSRRRHSRGEIVGYISVDGYRLAELPWWFHLSWSLPLQLLLGVGVLYFAVGLGVLPGLLPLILFGFLNVPFAKKLQRCQTRVLGAQDERLRVTSEILNSMKIVKLQGWEGKFRRVVEEMREKEFKWIEEAQVKKAYGSGLYWMSPTVVAAVVLGGAAAMGTAAMNAGTVFTVLATLRVMAEPAKMLPEVISVMIQMKVSLDRLEGFLKEEELREDDVERSNGGGETSVRIDAGEFAWEGGAATTLAGVDLVTTIGEKIAVCGPVGAGKSSLLAAILGEIPKLSGKVEVAGEIAYVAQSSWIQSGTIRENILFGKPMNKARYDLTVKVCALMKDLESMDHGDLTEIGQRGINLSGGQKQRIQLARAVYSNADVYLLDDPFSAVDAHTASTLFHDCVMGALRDKTVILVTHQVEFLAETDKILVMEGGRITQSGTYQDLLKFGTAFETLVNAHHSALAVLDTVGPTKMPQPPPPTPTSPNKKNRYVLHAKP